MAKKKKHVSALASPPPIAAKRGRAKRGKAGLSGQKGGILTKHHPEAAPATNGAVERRVMFKWRAMELKLQGKTLREIAEGIQEDFELVERPGLSTVDEWLDEAFAEAWSAKQSDADRHCTVIMLRTEKLIGGLLPLALGNVIVSRTRIVDGAPVEILDERAIDERLKATAEVRKLLETQAKLLKIGRVGERGEEGAMNGHSLTLLIEKAVTQNIVIAGTAPREYPTLVAASGDAAIDLLDAEATGAVQKSDSSI